MSRSLFWIGVIFASVGAVLLAFAGYTLTVDQALDDNGLRTQGTVVGLERRTDSDGDATYAPVVDWTDARGNQHRLISGTGTYPARYERGDEVTVLYDPDKPGRAVIDSFGQRFTAILIFGGLGLVFALIGLPFIYFYWRRQWIIRRLRASGSRIQATFIRCEIDRSTTTRGRSPYRVYAQGKHPKTGKLASFKSEPIWLDLTSTLDGKTVPVLVDRQRYRDHYVELDQWVHDNETA